MPNRKVLFVSFLCIFSPIGLAGDDQPPPAGVMAARGQGSVTPKEFDARVSKIPTEKRTVILRDATKVRTLLANLLLTSQLVAEATKDGFAQGDEQIELRMKMAAETELANAWIDHIANSAPDADYTVLAQEYYQLNQKNFEVGPRVDVTHLLISTKDRTVEEAELLAQSYLDKIQSEPSSFDELVVLYSEDPSVVSNGGRFTEVKEGVMVKPFEQAAFSLENVGDISGLVQTQYGFHIIRLDKTHTASVLSFEEVRAQLELKMATEHRERFRDDYLRNLTSMATNVSDEEIRAMIQRYFEVEESPLQSNPSNTE